MRIRKAFIVGGLAILGCDDDSPPDASGSGSIIIEHYCAPSQLPCLIVNRRELENGGTVDEFGLLNGDVVRIIVYQCDPERTFVSQAAPQRLSVQCHANVKPWDIEPRFREQPALEAVLDIEIELDAMGPMRMTGRSTIDGVADGEFNFKGAWNTEDVVTGFTRELNAYHTVGWLGEVTFRLEAPAGMVLQPPMWPLD